MSDYMKPLSGAELQERIAKRIHQLRVIKTSSQEEMSKLLNMSRSAYSKLETGETHLSYEMAVALCRLHNVPLDFFIHDQPTVQLWVAHQVA